MLDLLQVQDARRQDCALDYQRIFSAIRILEFARSACSNIRSLVWHIDNLCEELEQVGVHFLKIQIRIVLQGCIKIKEKIIF